MKKFWLAFLFCGVQAPLAKASTVGNGGDAVVCRWGNGLIRTVETLDLYEARIQRDIRARVPSQLDSAEDILQFVLDRFAKVDPERAASYRKTAADFAQNAHFSNEVLVDIPDHGVLLLQPGCAIEQFAIQRPMRFPEDKTYLVQNQLWLHLVNKKNHLQRAAIILHEVIYTEFLAHGHTTSEAARYFNSALFAGTFNNYSPEAYRTLVTSLGLN
jgi:hypothetical protein